MPLTLEERRQACRDVLTEHGVDIAYGFPGCLDMEIINGIPFPHDSLKLDTFQSGCAEPWTSSFLSALLTATNQRTVLEVGGFTGQTSAWLALALERIGGGSLVVVEIDGARVRQVKARLAALDLKLTETFVVEQDSLQYIPTIANKSLGFVWLDGNHEKFHVEQEICRLWDKMKPGGIIAGHDVLGSCDLQTVFKKYGGIALNFPMLGPAGGVGLISIPL